jgi:hypothetical protein
MIDRTQEKFICALCGKDVDRVEFAIWQVKDGEEFPMHEECLTNAWIDGISDKDAIKYE